MAARGSNSILIHWLTKLFNAAMEQEHFLSLFKQSITVPLPNPQKPGNQVNSYRPIALLSTTDKRLEAIMAQRLQFQLEKETLIPERHYGGRNGRSVDDCLHDVVETICKAWHNGMMATAVSMDITGAFDHVLHPRLLHNMAKRKLGGKWTAIVKSFLTGRSTSIRLLQGLQDREDIEVGIPQGSPLSLLLFHDIQCRSGRTGEVCNTGGPEEPNHSWMDRRCDASCDSERHRTDLHTARGKRPNLSPLGRAARVPLRSQEVPNDPFPPTPSKA
jgi:hypothetical protein